MKQCCLIKYTTKSDGFCVKLKPRTKSKLWSLVDILCVTKGGIHTNAISNV
jgi:hypothetical protein